MRIEYVKVPNTITSEGLEKIGEAIFADTITNITHKALLENDIANSEEIKKEVAWWYQQIEPHEAPENALLII
jgi:hypothetical protein